MKYLAQVLCVLFSFSAIAGIGKVIKLKGEAKSVQGATLREGSLVNQGDVIRTGAQSFVRVKLDDGVVLQAGPLSEIKIIAGSGPTTLEVVRGSLLSVIRPGKIERYKVKTPVATFGVRGTRFFVEEKSNEPTYLCVCEGGVSVDTKVGNKLVSTKTHTPMSLNSMGIMPNKSPISKEHVSTISLGDELHTDLENTAL